MGDTFLGTDDDGHTYQRLLAQSLDVVVIKTDATFGGTCADAAGSVGAMDADAREAGLQTQEIMAIGMLDETLAIVEIVTPVGGIVNLLEQEVAFGGAVVALPVLLPEIHSTSYRISDHNLALAVDQSQGHIHLADENKTFAHVGLIELHYGLQVLGGNRQRNGKGKSHAQYLIIHAAKIGHFSFQSIILIQKF